VQHFSFLSPEVHDELFFKVPEDIQPTAEKDLLALSLGATIYCPATRENLFDDIIKLRGKGAGSIIICLEDSVPDVRLKEAEDNLVSVLERLNERGVEDLPLLFVRPRTPEHFNLVGKRIVPFMKVLTGFAFPKFTQANATYFLSLTSMFSSQIRQHLYAMPILESPSIIIKETRMNELAGIFGACQLYRDTVLAIRIGATDMASPYGLRRSRDLTIYDVHLIASAIGDIVNTFGQVENGFIITGPVWEHFTNRERLFKPRLRASPFGEAGEAALRHELIVEDLDGLIREIELDRANGIQGKTVIHPTHISLVNSMLVVSKEEFSDANEILGINGGAVASSYRNKMNEAKPHAAWARKTLLRAKAFGVSNEKKNFVDFLEASMYINA
jgi:citrate lyase beta subunit